MDVLDEIAKLFTRKKSLQEISREELDRERVSLELEERNMIKRIEDLEAQKRQLFLKGKDEPSPRQQRILAEKIKEVDVQGRNLDKNLQLVARQRRIIHGLIQIKEQESLLRKLGLSDIIKKLDLETLQRYVEQAMVNEQLSLDRLGKIVGVFESSASMVEEGKPDEDVEQILKIFQETKAAEAENPTAAEEGLKKLNALLTPPEPPEREV